MTKKFIDSTETGETSSSTRYGLIGVKCYNEAINASDYETRYASGFSFRNRTLFARIINALNEISRFPRHPRKLFHILLLPVMIFIILFILFTYASKHSTDIAYWIDEPIAYPSLPHIIVLGADTAEMRKSITRSYKKGKNFSKRLEQACHIPKLNINGSEVIGFFHHVNMLDCGKNKEKEWAYVDEKGLFTISSDAIRLHGNIRCTVAYFERIDDSKLKIDRQIPISPGSPMSKDYAIVKCLGDDQEEWFVENVLFGNLIEDLSQLFSTYTF